MNKQEWQSTYSILSEFLSTFTSENRKMNNSKNAKDHSIAKEQMESAISWAGTHIESKKEVYLLLAGGNDKFGQGSREIFNDLKNIDFFEQDLSSLLVKIKEKIISLDN